MKKTTWLWILAVAITLAAAIYQRTTGPTWSKQISFKLMGDQYTQEFPRSHGGNDSCLITLDIPNQADARLWFKKFPTSEKYQVQGFRKKDGRQTAALPPQPPAGKIKYFIEIQSNKKKIYIARNEPIIIRFKGEVSDAVLIPHVLIMFSAMLLSTVAGLFALFKINRFRLYGLVTLILLAVGGFIFGPLMQYQAFGDAWTGIPFGWDLTDNKTLIAFLGWLTAVISNRKKYRPRDYVIAAVLLLVVYSIPHSMMGSEYDYSKGEVTTGMISFFPG
ncbi:MAG: hypothetical protein KGY60_09625 [Bacteroidales bacterium]|nr:hypothetical protein [Bacteroidales bacterium]